MINARLDYVLLDKRMKLKELAEKTGIAVNNLSILKTNKARAIRFSTLNAICEAMDCKPGDLLEYVPENESNRQTEWCLCAAFWAQAFELNSLVEDGKSFWRFYHRDHSIGETMRLVAACAGKVRMALGVGTVMGKFKVPGPFPEKGFMDDSSLEEGFEDAVNGYLVRNGAGEFGGNLFMRNGFAGIEQDA
jgi:putative transcriptional regulator